LKTDGARIGEIEFGASEGGQAGLTAQAALERALSRRALEGRRHARAEQRQRSPSVSPTTRQGLR
jgi:hypothetical protein